jgi:hypothetical protein
MKNFFNQIVVLGSHLPKVVANPENAKLDFYSLAFFIYESQEIKAMLFLKNYA